VAHVTGDTGLATIETNFVQQDAGDRGARGATRRVKAIESVLRLDHMRPVARPHCEAAARILSFVHADRGTAALRAECRLRPRWPRSRHPTSALPVPRSGPLAKARRARRTVAVSVGRLATRRPIGGAIPTECAFVAGVGDRRSIRL
jgi:hypothetical protein